MLPSTFLSAKFTLQFQYIGVFWECTFVLYMIKLFYFLEVASFWVFSAHIFFNLLLKSGTGWTLGGNMKWKCIPYLECDSSPNICTWYSRLNELSGQGLATTCQSWVTSLLWTSVCSLPRKELNHSLSRESSQIIVFPRWSHLQSYLNSAVTETQEMRAPQNPSLKDDSGSRLRASTDGDVHWNNTLFTKRNGRVLRQCDKHILSL